MKNSRFFRIKRLFYFISDNFIYCIYSFNIISIDIGINIIKRPCSYHFEENTNKGNGVSPTLFIGKRIASLHTDFTGKDQKTD